MNNKHFTWLGEAGTMQLQLPRMMPGAKVGYCDALKD